MRIAAAIAITPEQSVQEFRAYQEELRRAQAEIQKRQQAASDLKRQVEQITALASEEKKAGIHVADALRKRKLRASLKDVKIRDPADVQRRLANSADIDSFLSCHLPDVFCTPKSATRS